MNAMSVNAGAAGPAKVGSGRNDGLDQLRGLFLVLMTLTHVPTALSILFGQPFGFVSAAEGFVLMSAYLTGVVYGRRQLRDGPAVSRRALFERAGKVYRTHMMLVLFGLTVILTIGTLRHEGAVLGMFHYYLMEPVTAAAGAAALLYQPPLFDILPMYVIFLLLSPLVLRLGQTRGWLPVLIVSLVVWTLAQLGLRTWFHAGLISLTHLKLPLVAMGSFNPFAWQFLWVIGLWMGAASIGIGQPVKVSHGPGVALSLVLITVFVIWRHTIGWNAFGEGHHLNRLFDKWDLGGLRMANMFAMAVVITRFGPAISKRFPLKPLTRLGRASLWVFAAHVVCASLALSIFGPAERENGSWLLDLCLLMITFTVLALVAEMHALSNGPKTPRKPALEPAT